MKIARTLTAAVLAAGLCVAAGCQNNSSSSMDTAESGQVALGTLNEICPMSVNGKVNANVEPSEYGGHKIGFCCAGCKATWDEKKEDTFKEAFVRSLTK